MINIKYIYINNFSSYRMTQCRRWLRFVLSSGVLVRVLMLVVWLLGADILVLAWLTAGTLVRGDAWRLGAVGGPGNLPK